MHNESLVVVHAPSRGDVDRPNHMTVSCLHMMHVLHFSSANIRRLLASKTEIDGPVRNKLVTY